MTDMEANIRVDMRGNLERRAQRYGRALGRFSSHGQRDLGRLRRSASATGQLLEQLGGRYSAMLAAGGTAYAGYRVAQQSARLNKSLIQTRQTAGASKQAVEALRTELFQLSRDTGQAVDKLLRGFNQLIQAGMSWDEALATVKAIGPTMTVTGAQADTLGVEFDRGGRGLRFRLIETEDGSRSAGSHDPRGPAR
jgi:phage tail tape-measure protein